MDGRLLLVDDNAEFLDSIKDVLEDTGYTVATAMNGEEALTLFRKHSFDVVLMDIRMPGLNGVETFLKMKENDPKVKVILFTAHSMEGLIQKALQEGVYDVLDKPLNISRLLQLIKDVGTREACILIVDDDRTFCDSLRDALNQTGYKVTTVFEGAEAVQKAKYNAFDIMLLDMKLPGTNGLEVLREVKQVQPGLVTILITGYQEEFSGLIRQAIYESAYTYLKKPIEMKKLLMLLGEIMTDKTNDAPAG